MPSKIRFNIVLIGYRGTGKSTVARNVARYFGTGFFSTDKIITEMAGMPVRDIVVKYGWERFREMEKEVVRKVSEFDHSIIDCGGGVVEDMENVLNLKKKGKLFLLESKVEDIVSRIEHDIDRPPLQDGTSLRDEVVHILQKREVAYRSSANFVINTSQYSIQEAVRTIIEIVTLFE